MLKFTQGTQGTGFWLSVKLMVQKPALRQIVVCSNSVGRGLSWHGYGFVICLNFDGGCWDLLRIIIANAITVSPCAPTEDVVGTPVYTMFLYHKIYCKEWWWFDDLLVLYETSSFVDDLIFVEAVHHPATGYTSFPVGCRGLDSWQALSGCERFVGAFEGWSGFCWWFQHVSAIPKRMVQNITWLMGGALFVRSLGIVFFVVVICAPGGALPGARFRFRRAERKVIISGIRLNNQWVWLLGVFLATGDLWRCSLSSSEEFFLNAVVPSLT